MDEDDNPLLSSMMELEEENTRSQAFNFPAGGGPAAAGVRPLNINSVQHHNNAASRPGSRLPSPQHQAHHIHRGSVMSSSLNNGTSGTSASSYSSSEGSELVTSFRTLRQSSGISTSSVGEAFSAIEAMPHNKLVKFAKDLFSIVENFSMKHSDLEASVNLMESGSNSVSGDYGHHPSEPLPRAFVRAHRRGSSDTYRSTASLASIVRSPVAETTKLTRSSDEEGNKTVNHYSVIADLGKGAFAKVKLGQNNITGQTVAIKIIKKCMLKGAKSNAEALQREIAIMKKLRHKNIVALYEVIDDPAAEKLYLIMQYVENGPIVHVRSDFTCEPLDEAKVVLYLRQLCSGLRYLHKHQVVHRDIKPQNILASNDGTVYIADFGVSEITESLSHTVTGMQGTPICLAPELVARTDARTDGAAADCWALGVTLYLMLFGNAPFVGKNFQEIAESIQTKPLQLPINSALTHRWKDIVHGLLEKNPAKRMTLSQLKSHKIFSNIDMIDRPMPVTRRELTGALRNCRMFLAGDDDDDNDQQDNGRGAAKGTGSGSSGGAAAAKLTPATKAKIQRFLARVREKIAAKARRKTNAFVDRAASFNAPPSARGGVGVRGLLAGGGGPGSNMPSVMPHRPQGTPLHNGRQSPSTARLLSSMQVEPVTGASSAGKKPPEKAIELPQLNLKRALPGVQPVGTARRRV